MGKNEGVNQLEKEQQATNDRLKSGVDTPPAQNTTDLDHDTDQAINEVAKAMTENAIAALKKSLKGREVFISNKPTVKIERWPEIFPVKGEVTIKDFVKFIDTVQGALKEAMERPDLQKIGGQVSAEVSNFPDMQKVEGEVEITNLTGVIEKLEEVKEALAKKPQTQKITGDVTLLNFPIAEDGPLDKVKNNPRKYVPVRLTNGKFFYDIFTNVGNKVKSSVSLLSQELINRLNRFTFDTSNNLLNSMGTALSRSIDSIDANQYGTPVETTFQVTSSSQTALAANANAKYRSFQNDSDANMWLSFDGGAAAVNVGARLPPSGWSGNPLRFDRYIPIGQVTVIHDSTGNKPLIITEG